MKKELSIKKFSQLQEFANKILSSNFFDGNRKILFVSIIGDKIDLAINSVFEKEIYVFSASKDRRFTFDYNGEQIRSSGVTYKEWKKDIFSNMSIFYIGCSLYKILEKELCFTRVISKFVDTIRAENDFLKDENNRNKERIAFLSGIYTIGQFVARPISEMINIFSPEKICLSLDMEFSKSNFSILSCFLKNFFYFNCNNKLRSQKIEIFNGLGENCKENKVFVLKKIETSAA